MTDPAPSKNQPRLRVIDNPLADYHMRVYGYALPPDAVRAILQLIRKRHPSGFTRKQVAAILHEANIPTKQPKGTYVSPRDGKEYRYPKNPAMALAGRLLERMSERGIIRFKNGTWYFSGSKINGAPPKFL